MVSSLERVGSVLLPEWPVFQFSLHTSLSAVFNMIEEHHRIRRGGIIENGSFGHSLWFYANSALGGRLGRITSCNIYIYMYVCMYVCMYVYLKSFFFQFSSVAQSCPTLCDPWIAARQASLSITISQSLLKLMPIESVMPSSHLILCRPLLLLPPIPPSIRVFSNESTLRMRWPKYWSFSFSIIPSNEHPGLISFRMDWLDLLAVQGTLKSLFQHHSSKASIFWLSAFLTVQLSHPYMTTRKTIALTRWTFVGKVVSLLFNMLSRLVITFLPGSKHLLNFMAVVTICSDFRVLKNKVWHCFHCFPIYFPWSDGTKCHDLSFLNVKF